MDRENVFLNNFSLQINFILSSQERRLLPAIFLGGHVQESKAQEFQCCQYLQKIKAELKHTTIWKVMFLMTRTPVGLVKHDSGIVASR